MLLLLLAACKPAEAPGPPPPSPITTATAPTTATAAPPTATQATATPTSAPPVQGRKLQPVDEAGQDPSFAAYRAGLLDAVHRRDREALLRAIDPKIRTNFGGGGGGTQFAKQWKLDDPGSRLWPELETILTHGGAFSKDEGPRSFWAPYVYSSIPDTVDAFESLIVLGEAVPLHESPARDAKVLATLAHDILTRVAGRETEGWAHVKTDDGRTGWVEAAQVRSPIGYRAGFAKTGGAWKMNALVASD